jgi:hypothetical protein
MRDTVVAWRNPARAACPYPPARVPMTLHSGIHEPNFVNNTAAKVHAVWRQLHQHAVTQAS